MASYTTTPWQIDGETIETMTDFTFLGFKFTQMVQMVPAAMKLKGTS